MPITGIIIIIIIIIVVVIMKLMIMMMLQVLSNGSLAVSEVYMEDSGTYGCTAKNSGGSERAELHLHVTSISTSGHSLGVRANFSRG